MKARTSRATRISDKMRASQSSLDGGSASADALAESSGSHGGLATVISLLARVRLSVPPPAKAGKPKSVSVGTASSAPHDRAHLRDAAVPPRATVQERSDEEIAALQDGSPESNAKLKTMAVAAEILEALADTHHAKLLVAQGGLLAVAKALSWDLLAAINTACAMVVHKLVHDDACYLQMVRSLRHAYKPASIEFLI